MIDSRFFRCALLVVALLPLASQGAQSKKPQLVYRYKDAQGRTVMTRQAVPSDAAQKGYEILNDKGTVIQVIPPALTAEQARQKEAADKRAAEDKELLDKYANLEEFDSIKQRQITDTEGLIGVSVRSLGSLQRRQEADLAKAAEFERSGMEVPEDLTRDLANIKSEREALNRQIEAQRKSIADMKTEYEAVRPRVIELFKDRK